MQSGVLYQASAAPSGSSKLSLRLNKDARKPLGSTAGLLSNGRYVPDMESPTTIADFAPLWLDGLANQGRKATTLRGYRGVLRTHVLPALGSMPLEQLQASDLDTLYASLLRSKLAMTSVHHVHAVVSKMLHDAERKGLVTHNVARLASAPSLNAARARGPEMKVWSPSELSTFLTSIEGNRNAVLFRVMAMTGIRRGEAVGLRWSDVNLDRCWLTVNQSASVVDGEEIVDVPKTRRSRRVIDLDAETVRLLRCHHASQRELWRRLAVAGPSGDRVFTNPTGGALRPDSVGQAFGRLIRSAGLPPIRLHDLRHTHASHLLIASVNVKVVSERLGHSSVSFTLDTYAHVMPGQQAEAAAAAAALLRPS
ncbi:site-specific integrase [soil metagenome]